MWDIVRTILGNYCRGVEEDRQKRRRRAFNKQGGPHILLKGKGTWTNTHTRRVQALEDRPRCRKPDTGKGRLREKHTQKPGGWKYRGAGANWGRGGILQQETHTDAER